jgi:hypothetical protein
LTPLSRGRSEAGTNEPSITYYLIIIFFSRKARGQRGQKIVRKKTKKKNKKKTKNQKTQNPKNNSKAPNPPK